MRACCGFRRAFSSTKHSGTHTLDELLDNGHMSSDDGLVIGTLNMRIIFIPAFGKTLPSTPAGLKDTRLANIQRT